MTDLNDQRIVVDQSSVIFFGAATLHASDSFGHNTSIVDTQFDQLSPRQRDCLRLAYQRRTSKEIAITLGIRPGTVSTYCAEAVAILGAVDRRHAAELLHAHEQAPSELGPTSAGLVTHRSPPSLPLPTGRPAHFLGPLAPANREADNDQGIITRLAWILLLAIGIAIGFGSLAAAVRTFSDLARHGSVQRPS